MPSTAPRRSRLSDIPECKSARGAHKLRAPDGILEPLAQRIRGRRRHESRPWKFRQICLDALRQRFWIALGRHEA